MDFYLNQGPKLARCARLSHQWRCGIKRVVRDTDLEGSRMSDRRTSCPGQNCGICSIGAVGPSSETREHPLYPTNQSSSVAPLSRRQLRNALSRLERLAISESLSITSVVADGRFLPRIKSNVAKTIIDPTTATDAATRIRNTATINPLIIAIRVTRGVVHSPKGANPSEDSVR